MPPASLYERLQAAAAELLELLDRCEAELPHKPRRFASRPMGKVQAGTTLTSWNTQIAMIVLDCHAGVRQLEQEIRSEVSGSRKARGGSDANTVQSVAAITSLAAAAGDYELGLAVRKMESWGWRCRVALGQAEPLQQIPRQPGHSAARCPWCRMATLRMKPVSGVVRCINPGCKDDEGQQPSGHVQFGTYSQEPVLVWQDNSVGLAAEPSGSAERRVKIREEA
jgi:hypothetical protein